MTPTRPQALLTLLTTPADRYDGINAVRDWVNATYPTVELYLEDNWDGVDEGGMRFEYLLRDRVTRHETGVLVYDQHRARRDPGGVMHVGDYVETVLEAGPPETIVAIIDDFLTKYVTP
ncbi:MAG: hypothetical protein AB7P76_08285 [Candidatus Melainabacteria bacterium]